jgi:hypothetical protein
MTVVLLISSLGYGRKFVEDTSKVLDNDDKIAVLNKIGVPLLFRTSDSILRDTKIYIDTESLVSHEFYQTILNYGKLFIEYQVLNEHNEPEGVYQYIHFYDYLKEKWVKEGGVESEFLESFSKDFSQLSSLEEAGLLKPLNNLTSDEVAILFGELGKIQIFVDIKRYPIDDLLLQLQNQNGQLVFPLLASLAMAGFAAWLALLTAYGLSKRGGRLVTLESYTNEAGDEVVMFSVSGVEEISTERLEEGISADDNVDLKLYLDSEGEYSES